MATPNSKHWPINWVDGMKITKDHLLGSDLAATDALRDVAQTHLNAYTYGLLPSIDGKVSQLSQNGNEGVIISDKVLSVKERVPGPTDKNIEIPDPVMR